MSDTFFCFHGHFYQPPRGSAFEGDSPLEEPEAAPYRNWNEKVATECYVPNADLGNFGYMNFSVGITLLGWLETNRPETYQQILQADRDYRAVHGVGNALALPTHHTILPLASDRDKVTQVKWGLASFQHHFNRPAGGLWLPEMAVDLKTLQVLAENGVRFTLLSQGQVKDGDALPGAGPYWVDLPEGGQITVYVRNDKLSIQLAYGVHNLGGAGRWSRDVLLPHRKRGHRLTLLAAAGETFGHHYRGEEHFLHWLLRYEAGAVGYQMSTLACDLRDNPPRDRIEIHEYSAWSCSHRLSRWFEGCDCTTGDSRWKSALRRALDSLAAELDHLYQDAARAAGVDPWVLRDDYIRVVLDHVGPEAFLAEHNLGGLDTARTSTLLGLLRAQFHSQRMYVSSTFFHEDLDRPEPRYAIASALAAARLARQVTAEDLLPDFRRKLDLAVSGRSGLTGTDLLDEARSLAANPGPLLPPR